MTTIPCNTQTRHIFSSGNVFQKIFPDLKPDTDEICFKAQRVQIKMKAAARPQREVKILKLYISRAKSVAAVRRFLILFRLFFCFMRNWYCTASDGDAESVSFNQSSAKMFFFIYPRPYRCFKVSFVNRRCWPLFFYAAKAFLSPLLIAGRRITLSGTRFKRGPFTFISCFQAINRLFIHHA